MRSAPDDLERLPRMSPADEPVVPTGVDRRRRAPWMLTVAMVVFGLGLVFVSGFFLLHVLAWASTTDPEYPRSLSEAWIRFFGLKHGGPVAIPAFFGLLFGVAFVALGIDKAGAKRG